MLLLVLLSKSSAKGLLTIVGFAIDCLKLSYASTKTSLDIPPKCWPSIIKEKLNGRKAE